MRLKIGMKPWTNTLCLSLLLFGALPLFGQSNIGYRIDQSISVSQDGSPLRIPFAGGMSAPQFSAIDLNDDSVEDLVVFDRQGNLLKPFLYQGSPHPADYQFAPEYRANFPFVDRFALFRDYNCDGKADLFTYFTGGFRVWKNTSSGGQLSFEIAYPHLQADFGNGFGQVYTLPIDIPAIVDVDSDGDLDILSFGPGGSDGNVYYYRNLSVEEGLPCDSLKYELADACWGKFREDPLTNSIFTNVTCKGAGEREGERHSGSTILALDQDGDQDLELILGDVSYTNLTFLTNGGDLNTATITHFDSIYPTSGTPVDMPIFPGAFHLDIDHDGKRDLLASPNTANGAVDTANSWFYPNMGTDAVPDFQLAGKRWLSEDMIELGTGSNPIFFDENADGKLDILVGNFGYWQPSGTPIGQLALYRNVGTSSQPAFDRITSDYLNLAALNMRGISPTVGDLDGDGDTDLILGDQEGKLHYFENTAGSGQVANLILNAPNFANIDVGLAATPQLVDVDRDGKLDLLVGERSGRIHYFRNSGTSSAPVFSNFPNSDFFGEIDTQPFCCTGYATPFLSELDASGEYYLTVGSEKGIIYVYDQVEGNLGGAFRLVDSIVTHGHRVNYAFGSLTADAPPELVIGEFAGGLQVLHKDFNIPIGINLYPSTISQVKLFPNPTADVLQIRFAAEGTVNWQLIDILGRQWQQGQFLPSDGDEISLSLRELPVGVYFLRLERNGYQHTAKVIRE